MNCLKHWIATFGLLTLVLLIGCQRSIQTDYHKLDLGEVKGTIKVDGQPLANAHIIFQSPENADFSTGKTDDNGRYTMMFNSEKEGVLAGEQIVRIRKRRFTESDYIRFRNRILRNDESVDEEDESDPEAQVAGDFDSVNPGVLQQTKKTTTAGELPEAYHEDAKIRVTVEKRSQTLNFDLGSDGSTDGPS